jgi:hypothetical protein
MIMMKKKSFSLIIALTLGIFLYGCSGGGDGGGEGDEIATGDRSAEFVNELVYLNDQITQGQISDDDFIEELASILEEIDNDSDGPVLLQEYLEEDVLDYLLSESSMSANSPSLGLKVGAVGDILNDIADSEAWLVLKTFFESLIYGQVPGGTFLQAARPEVVTAVASVKTRTEIYDALFSNQIELYQAEELYNANTKNPLEAKRQLYSALDESVPSYLEDAPSGCLCNCSDEIDAWLGVGTGGSDGSGTVTASPAGISCGSDCSEIYDLGTVVTLTATPDEGSTFDGWSGLCSGDGNCIVTMDADKGVVASFSSIPVPDGDTGFVGTWSGTYNYTSVGDGGCTYNSSGTMTMTISVDESTASGTTSVDGFELRWTDDCSLYGYVASSGTFTATISGDIINGTSSYPIAETGGTWTPSFSGTLSDNTISGTLSATGSGTFSLTRQ